MRGRPIVGVVGGSHELPPITSAATELGAALAAADAILLTGGAGGGGSAVKDAAMNGAAAGRRISILKRGTGVVLRSPTHGIVNSGMEDARNVLNGFTPDVLIAMRDPYGVRPLCIGKLNGNGWIVASESCALDHLGAEFVREVEPGEAVVIDEQGLHAMQAVEKKRDALCVFEYIYFARPDSIIRGKLLHPMRMNMGRELARQAPVDADLVIGVPDSATAAAIGYSHEAGIPYAEGLVKNRYVGRTFIQPDQRMRDQGVYLKFNPMRQVIEGKRLVVVDDSIVRGTTTPKVVEMLRKAGAKEVHMRICAPPIRHPCHFGIDMATQWELIAAKQEIEQIRQHIGADSLAYLTIEGLMSAVEQPKDSFCTACFTGEYPMPVQLQMDKLVFERAGRGGKRVPVGVAWSWEEDRR